MKIGVLALQGAFREHLETLRAIGVEGVRVREPADLERVSGLILPGGESTTMRQLIERWGLRQPILDLAEARHADLRDVRRDDRPGRPDRRRRAADPAAARRDSVARNAFGRQLDSFEADLVGADPRRHPGPRGLHPRPGDRACRAGVDVLARLDDGRIVAVRQRNVIATAFHPELAGETRFHRLVATMAAEHDDPGEGSGRRPHPTRRARQPR